jgi:hypothetical protein
VQKPIDSQEAKAPLDIHELGGLSPDEVRAQLERILASVAFGRSERCQQFLHYVCDLTLRGDGSRINQYLIGSEVFKRGPDYSTDEDSLVRRQAHLLRQKLDTYYSREGKTDLVRIDLPVGHYVPTFRRQVLDIPVAEPAAPVEPSSVSAYRLRAPLVLFAVLGGLGLLTIGWIGGRQATSPTAYPQLPVAVQEIWGPWLQNPAGPMICLSNPMTAVVRHNPSTTLLPGHLAVAPAQDKAFRELFNLHSGGELSLYPSRVNTKIGESLGVALLAVFLTKMSVPVHVTQSRLVSWEDLRTQDFILMGHNEGNPWLDPLLSKYPFRLGPSPQGRRNILISSAGKGEASSYEVNQLDGQNGPTQEYALISMIQGLDSRRRLLLINGLNTQATQMATELVTDPDRLQQLYVRLKAAAPNHRGAWYFQVIVRTEVRDKVPTTGPEIIALRVL